MFTEFSPARITRTRLADGRALSYYDDREPFVSGVATRTLVDRRELPPQQPRPIMRFDVLGRELVRLRECLP
ncbi:MAG TPA: hypothetical protein VGI84_11235 [Pseudonocardiaceae bacterium]